MVVKEICEINGKQYNHVFSDDGHILRCGRIRYDEAIDPIDIDKTYFEDGVIPVETENEEIDDKF